MSVVCAFATALPGWRGELALSLPPGCTVAQALDAARAVLREQLGSAADGVLADGVLNDPAWQSGPVGIFGEPCTRERPLQAGDRIELYVPLQVDPKAARRARARPMQTEKGRNPLTRR